MFRDNSAMGLSPELWPAIARNLERSDWLVVLASPDARQSTWVNREIEHWLESDRSAAERLLLVLTDGELVWDSQRRRFDRQRSSALPDAIPDVEPRYLDMRWYRATSDSERSTKLDLRHARFRDAIAEIAAPVHGVAKDELDSEAVRIERRGRRLRTAAIFGLAALAVVASVLGVMATASADRARDELAVSEARRSLLSSQLAPTHRQAVRRAEDALVGAQAVGRADASFVDGLFTAAARDDLPLEAFAGISEPDSFTGGNRGISFAPDGSAFAYIGTDDAVHVIDTWTLTERQEAPLDDLLSEHEVASPYIQTSFSYDAEELAIVTGSEVVVVRASAVADVVSRASVDAANEPMAATISPTADVIGVLDYGMVFTAYDLRTGEVIDRLGTELPVADADVVRVTISADQNRLCATGAGRVRHAQVDPPALLADFGGAGDCWSEGCEGTLRAVLSRQQVARDGGDELGLACVAADSTVLADYGLPGYGLAEFTGLALSTLDRDSIDDVGFIGLGLGQSLLAVPADVAVTDAVFTVPEDQEWFGARVVQHATGPVLVDYRDDGDITVWSLARGLLSPTEVSQGAAPTAGTPVLPPEGAAEPVALVEDYTDDGNALSVSSAADRSRAVQIPRSGEPVLVASTSNTQVLAVLSDGSAYGVDLASGAAPVELDLPVEGQVRAATYRSGLLAVGSSDGVDVLEVGRDLRSAAPTLASASFDAPVCQVDISADGAVLAAVSCTDAGAGDVVTIDIDSGRTILEPTGLRYRLPNSVSVTDDGRTVVVAFILGQIAIRSGDEWVEPAALSVGKRDHNVFQRGWAAVDPTGEFMVTRRDGDGLELWRAAASGDAPLARLTRHEYDEYFDPPDRADFTDDVVTVSWANPTSAGYLRASWPLSIDGLRRTTCPMLSAPSGGCSPAMQAPDRVAQASVPEPQPAVTEPVEAAPPPTAAPDTARVDAADPDALCLDHPPDSAAEEIRFESGSSSGTVTATGRLNQAQHFRLTANADQTMQIDIDAPHLICLSGPSGPLGASIGQSGSLLPTTGEYVITVVPLDEPGPYSVTVTIP